MRKLTSNPNLTQSRKLAEEKVREREEWYKIVVKVILWRNQALEDRTSQKSDKVTPKEWGMYCKRILKQNPPAKRQKVLERLSQIKKTIVSNGGLEI